MVFNQNNKKDPKMSYSARNGKIQWEMVIFGGSGGSATVSSQFDIVQTYDSHHTQEEPWNSILKDAAPTYRQIPI